MQLFLFPFKTKFITKFTIPHSFQQSNVSNCDFLLHLPHKNQRFSFLFDHSPHIIIKTKLLEISKFNETVYTTAFK